MKKLLCLICSIIVLNTCLFAQNLQTIDGKNVSINEIVVKDKPTIVITFALWNKPGVIFIRNFADYYENASNVSVNVVAVAVDKRPIRVSSLESLCKDWPFKTYKCEDYSIVKYLDSVYYGRIGRKDKDAGTVNRAYRCCKMDGNIIVNRSLVTSSSDNVIFKFLTDNMSPYNGDYYDDIIIRSNSSYVKKNGKWGVIDDKGKTIIQLKYSYINDWNDCYVVKQNGKYGLLNMKGANVTPLQYDSLKVSDDLFLVRKGSMWGVLNNKGNVVIPIQYDKIDYYGGYAEVKKNEKYGVLNKQGNSVIPIIYDDIEMYVYESDKYFVAKKNGKYGCLDSQNRTVINFDYSDLDYLGDDLFKARKEKWGVIKKGKGAITQFNAEKVDYSSNIKKIVAVLVDNVWIAVKTDGGCLVSALINKSTEKTEKMGSLLLLYASKDGLGEVDCSEVDDNFYIIHSYIYEGKEK